MFVALFGFGILLNLAVNGFGHDAGSTEIGFVPGLFFVLLTILPSIALTVRRLHDIGLSGWLVLLCYVPAVGELAILVFGLMPSQVGENPWGAVPVGVRI